MNYGACYEKEYDFREISDFIKVGLDTNNMFLATTEQSWPKY